MESGKKSLEELTTAGVFHVPEYQRYYSWTEPEWDDLWTDLYTLPPDKQHYFGTIIIQKTDETESGGSTGGYGSSREKPINLLIDGQQRLTSLALLVVPTSLFDRSLRRGECVCVAAATGARSVRCCVASVEDT